MAKVIPQLDETDLNRIKSNAERKVYRRCSELDADTIAVFSFHWIKGTAYGTHRDGETDFLLFHKTKGILSVEVKGGGVAHDPLTDQWTSIDRHGTSHSIKSPFKQAHDGKYALREFFEGDSEWQRLNRKPRFGHAVLIPDINRDGAKQIQGADRPLEIIGVGEDLEHFPAWVDSVFEFWNGRQESATTELGSVGMAFIYKRLGSSIEAKPALSSVLKEEGEARFNLTMEQARTLLVLQNVRQAAISGGAGTGKTVLALKKAEQLARKGLKTLLLCYNSPLADQMKVQTADIEKLHPMSFHQLCKFFTEVAKTNSGQDFFADAKKQHAGQDEFDVCLPYALNEAIPHVKIDYDAIIIDEAQDFRDEYWMAIDTLIDDDENKHLYIFFDPNQRLYALCDLFPINEPRFPLTRNCRNTKAIHELAYQFYEGEPTESSPIPGAAIETINATGRKAQAKKLHAHLLNLLNNEGVGTSEICVLIPSESKPSYEKELTKLPLPGSAEWRPGQRSGPNGIGIETTKRFKGLEATYVYFWGVDNYSRAEDPEILYVTFSRAKSRLCLVGEQAACNSMLSQPE